MELGLFYSHLLPHLRHNLEGWECDRGKLELAPFFWNPGKFLIFWVGHIGVLCKAFFPSAHYHHLLKLTTTVCESFQSFVLCLQAKVNVVPLILSPHPTPHELITWLAFFTKLYLSGVFPYPHLEHFLIIHRNCWTDSDLFKQSSIYKHLGC